MKVLAVYGTVLEMSQENLPYEIAGNTRKQGSRQPIMG